MVDHNLKEVVDTYFSEMHKQKTFDQMLEEAIECMKRNGEIEVYNNLESDNIEYISHYVEEDKIYTQSEVDNMIEESIKEKVNNIKEAIDNKLFYRLSWIYGSDIEPFSNNRYYEASDVEDLLEEIKNLCKN